MITQLQNKNIYLAPKNNFTVLFEQKLKENDIIFKGYLDNVKKDIDVVSRNIFDDNDIVIIFSPNHWKEIVSHLMTQNIYILNVIDGEFSVQHLNLFDGYHEIPKLNYNKLDMQKVFWGNHLREFCTNNKDLNRYGYEWGNPEKQNDSLGNYLYIKEKLQSLIDEDSVILELGTLGGKWTQYILKGEKVICVDINYEFIEVIKDRYKNFIDKIDFYVSKGNELIGIEHHSIDIIFCMDTLVRVEKEYIFDYMKEISRVLKKDGCAIIHLPNSDIEDCRKRQFTNLTTKEINQELSKYFDKFILDSNTIVHGTLVYINC